MSPAENPAGRTGGTTDDNDDQYIRHRYIFNILPVGLVIVNARLQILVFNSAAESLTGYREHEVLGRTCREVLACSHCSSGCMLKNDHSSDHPDTAITAKDGRTLPASIHTAVLHNSAGAVQNGVISFQDISRTKALERERNELVSVITHDVKSSLSIIGGFAQRIEHKSDSLKRDTRSKYFTIIRKELEKLEHLMGDLLEYSHLQSGRLRLSMRSLSLSSELADLVELYRHKCRKNAVTINYECTSDPGTVKADAAHLRRVFTNILDNAVKHTPAGEAIWLKAFRRGDCAAVQVIDSGPGIDHESIDHIFQPYKRGSNNKLTKGYGIGLAVAKNIVEAHGGTIDVTSTEGEGAAFTILLPAAHSE